MEGLRPPRARAGLDRLDLELLKSTPGRTYFDSLDSSPLGRIDLVCSDQGLTCVQFHQKGEPLESIAFIPGNPILSAAKEQILAYLVGSICQFDLPIDWSGMTPFSREVRECCLRIPYGKTITYSELASLAGYTGKARAVGNVNARNPLTLVIPCHRVIGKDGSLRGYLGPDGVKTKAWLLEMEAQHASG
jgi:methylated-DNA-[protein]-cysteine S-methyltransferase